MASPNPPALKRPGKPRNKRFVLPVVPALPHLNTARKTQEIEGHQTEHLANGAIHDASGEHSRRASTTASLNLANGVHKDERPEASAEGAAAEIGVSSALASPVSQPGRSTPPSPRVEYSSDFTGLLTIDL